MSHPSAADAAGTPDPGSDPDDLPQDPVPLAAALERAIAGRAALVRQLEAAPAAPHAPVLRDALRLSGARIERLLARLASVAPPEARPFAERAA